MKPKEEKTPLTLEQEYNLIMKDFQNQNSAAPQVPQTPQWITPGDFITKFSLYQETPNSITSTDTLANIGI